MQAQLGNSPILHTRSGASAYVPEAEVQKSLKLKTILIFVVLLGIGRVAARNITTGEFNLNVDETSHAGTGLYFSDLLRDRPFLHPINYTYQYYAQYPMLGVVHWPPFFYAVEGFWFYVLGPSVTAARLLVLVFALAGLFALFKLVEELDGYWTALATTALVGLIPSVLLYEKSVMLEIPSLALCLGATYFWVKYLRTDASRYAYWFGLLAGLALLTKQNSIYLAPFCALTALIEGRPRLLIRRTSVRAAALAGLIAAPAYVLMYVFNWQTIKGDLFSRGPAHALGAARYAFYWDTLPHTLGWPLLVLSIVGILTSRWWASKQTLRIMLVWILACFLTFTAIGWKEPRYVIYWLPPFVYFAVGMLAAGLRMRRLRVAAAVSLGVLVAVYAAKGWRYQRPYVSGYAPAARYLVRTADPGVILFDGNLPGNLIFFMRAFDPGRRFIIARKALWVERIEKRLGSMELIKTTPELQDLIAQLGIKYIVVDENAPQGYEIQAKLRDLLKTPQFKLLQRFPIESNMQDWQGRSLEVYENTRAQPAQARNFCVKSLNLSRQVCVRIGALEHGRSDP